MGVWWVVLRVVRSLGLSICQCLSLVDALQKLLDMWSVIDVKGEKLRFGVQLFVCQVRLCEWLNRYGVLCRLVGRLVRLCSDFEGGERV